MSLARIIRQVMSEGERGAGRGRWYACRARAEHDARRGAPWEGVVRELKRLDASTVVVVLTGYGSIATAVESIKLGAASYLTKPADADQIVAAFDGAQPTDDTQIPSLARVEWEHIQRVLTDFGGNISQAARALGVHRRSLQRKLAKYPVSRYAFRHGSEPVLRRNRARPELNPVGHSSSTHATTLGAIRWCFGNSPRLDRAARQ